jgi:hypothetical protein
LAGKARGGALCGGGVGGDEATLEEPWDRSVQPSHILRFCRVKQCSSQTANSHRWQMNKSTMSSSSEPGQNGQRPF